MTNHPAADGFHPEKSWAAAVRQQDGDQYLLYILDDPNLENQGMDNDHVQSDHHPNEKYYQVSTNSTLLMLMMEGRRLMNGQAKP